jgi:hypothetical protein
MRFACQAAVGSVILASVAGCGISAGGGFREYSVSRVPVITPFGLLVRDCVHEVAFGEVVDERLDDRACAGRERAQDVEPPGWVEWGNLQAAEGVRSLEADFVVPPAPTNVKQQVIFIFPSATGDTNPPIIQPVLQWGESSAGGGSFWTLASWYIDAQINSFNSKLVRVQPGDHIKGTIVGTPPCVGGVCKEWTITALDVTNPSVTTTLRTTGGGSHYTQIQGAALETYLMDSCDQYPSLSESFTGIALVDNAGKALAPEWELNVNDRAPTQCAFKPTSPTPDRIDLGYSARTH